MADERLVYKLVRFYEIFKRVRNMHPDFNIDLKFSDATGGVSLDIYESFCFYLMANWVPKTKRSPDASNKDWCISKGKYFKETKLTEKEIDDVLSLLLIDVENYEKNYQESVSSALKGNDIYQSNFLLLRQRPLISYQESFVCPSPRLLIDKATDGIYWIIENNLKKKDEKEWKKFPSVWGCAFEDYVHKRLGNVFGEKYSMKFTIKDKEKFDGVIEGKEAIFLLEVKYAHWTLVAKASGKQDLILPTLRQILSDKEKIKGLGQITRSIREFEKGEWSFLFQVRSRKIIPIIIVGEAMPMDAYNRKFYEDFAKAANSFYENSKVLPFIILGAEEIEIIEAIAAESGSDAVEKLFLEYSQLFTERNADGLVKQSMEFKNYLFSIGHSTGNNPTLLEIYGEEIVNTASMKAFNKRLHK